MQCVQAHRTDLEEGGGDGQVRVVPEAHGEDGVYRLISLRAGRTCTLQYVLAIDRAAWASLFALMQASAFP